MLKAVTERSWYPRVKPALEWALFAAKMLFMFWVAMQLVYIAPEIVDPLADWMMERAAEEPSRVGKVLVRTIGITMTIGLAWLTLGWIWRAGRAQDARTDERP